MQATHRKPRLSSRRWTVGLAATALLAGLLAFTNLANADSHDTLIEGGVYGWGHTGGGVDAEAWELDFDNDARPFVDLAVHSTGTGQGHTTLAVTADGDLVADGDAGDVYSNRPPEIDTDHVVAIEVFRGAAAAITQESGIVTWNGAPGASTDCQNRVADVGAIDVQLILASSPPANPQNNAGVVLLGNGELCAWGRGNIVNNMPDIDGDVVKINGGTTGAIALTADGDVYGWGISSGSFAVSPEVAEATVVDITINGTTTAWALTDAGEMLHFGSSPSGNGQFPDDHGSVGQIVALGEASSQSLGNLAVTDRGEFIGWGFSSNRPFRETAPAHLEGYEVLAMASTSNSHHAFIVGEQLEDTGPEELTVAQQPTLALEDGADEARVGMIIEATPAVFEPSTGLEIEHRWFADGEPIEGADSAAYTLVEDDLGTEEITYQTHAERAEDEQSVTSEESNAIGPVLEAGLAFVDDTVIDGQGYIDVEHTAIPAATNDEENVEHAFEWVVMFDDEREDVTASGESFTPLAGHEGGQITVTQTATRGDGDSAESIEQDSDPVGPVRDEPAPVEVVTNSSISPSSSEGSVYYGDEVVGTPAVFSETQGISVQNYWQLDWLDEDSRVPAELDGDGLARLVLSAEDVERGGRVFFVSVATRDGEVVAESELDLFENVSFAVYVRLAAEQDPEIAGLPWVGEELSLGQEAVFNDVHSSVTVQYRWYAGDDEVGTGTSLELTEDHLDEQITVVARAGRGNDEAFAESDPIGPVTDAPEPVDFTGSPGIASDTDEIEVGATLTAQAAEFTGDIEGDPIHEWLIDGDLAGTGETFDLLAEHVDESIGLRTRVVELLTGDEIVSDVSEVGPVLPAPLAIDGVPTIGGNPWIGQDLSVTAAAVNDDEADVSFQWFADGEPIDGATGDVWQVHADHEDALITVVQIASREDATEPGRDYAESDASEPTAPVREAPVDLAVVDEADIEGPRLVGQTLLGTPAVFTDTSDEVVVTSYWVIDGEAVEADVSNELELTSEHVGADIWFRSVIEREIDEATMASTSETVIGPVLAALAVDTPVSLSGDAEVGATLTATPAVFNDAEATVVHTWLVDGDPVDHEGLTFELTAAHEGLVIGFGSEATRTVDGIEESDSSEAFSAEVGLPDDNGDDGGSSPTPPDDEALRCLAVTPDTVSAGSAHEVTVDLSDCGDWAGHEVRIWLFSNPVDLGTVTVGADGTFTVTIPAGVPAGAHQLAVYEPDGGVDENGDPVDVLIGYADLTITGDGAGGPGGSGLPATGYDGSPASLMLAVLLILTGGIALVAGRMRRSLRI